MAIRQNLRQMLSHRVTFRYDTGTKVVGTITACAPKEGPVEYLTLAKAEVVGAAGQVLARFAELPLVSAVLTDVSVTEGPL
jgi:hypothetical protein